MKRVHQSGLERKFYKWVKCLKLEGWNFKIRFKAIVPEEGNDGHKPFPAAWVEHCSPVERTAVINIATDYCARLGFGVSFNLDTLIIHELIHIILWDERDRLPTRVSNSSKFNSFEEFVCFHFSKIIYDVKHG